MDGPEPPDSTLVRAALRGDEGAFAEIVRRHKGRVCAMASRFARPGDDLDDLAQEIFVRVWKGLGAWRGDAPLGHWIARITTRACYDHLRKRQAHPEPVALLDHDALGEAEDVGKAELLAWGLERLSAEDRLVITLLELEERAVKEIASLTGWSEAKVKTRAHRARVALKRILQHKR